jgi:malonyl-CoA/methylmalonyl-CoA synthetase
MSAAAERGPDATGPGAEPAAQRSRRAWALHAGRAVDPAQLGVGTLPEAFHTASAAAARRPALDIDGVALTHGELDARAAAVGGWLREQGPAAGDALLLVGPSSMDLVCAYLGALRARLVVVLANPTYTEGELRHLASDSGAVAALAADPARGLLESAAGELPALKLIVDLGDVAGKAGGEPLAVEAGDPDDAALLAYTSGTTGRPKAVPLTHANLLSSIRAVMLAWRWSANDVLVHSLPLFHQHGLGGVHATLLAGSRAAILGRSDPAALIDTLERKHATVLFAVPAIYERLLGTEGIDAADLATLRLAVSGSAPLPPSLAERWAALAGQPPLERYGTTESGLDISNLYDGPRRPGAVGLPLPGVELAIADEAGGELPGGDVGEILLRGPQVFGGYRGAPDATAAAFHPGGWFRTGDLGRIAPADGYLEITGRAKDLIISGGMNIYPREVELALEAAHGIARAAVVGMPSERWGEEVAAVVVPVDAAAIDIDEIRSTLETSLAPYKRPKRIVVVDELPVNHMGKVVTAEVARLIEQA